MIKLLYAIHLIQKKDGYPAQKRKFKSQMQQKKTLN